MTKKETLLQQLEALEKASKHPSSLLEENILRALFDFLKNYIGDPEIWAAVSRIPDVASIVDDENIGKFRKKK